jgi:hypothetical protein
VALCIALHCIALHCIALHCSTFQWRPLENWQSKNMLPHMSATTLSIMTLIIITFSIMTLRITMNKMWHSAQPHSAYCRALLGSLAECQLYSMLFMLRFTYKPFMLSFIMLNVIILSVFMLVPPYVQWKKIDAKIRTLILTAYPNSLLGIEIFVQRD